MFEDLGELAGLCAQLVSENAQFIILYGYAARISGASLAGLLGQALEGRGGRIEWGELTLAEGADMIGGPREIGLSFFARWSAQ